MDNRLLSTGPIYEIEATNEPLIARGGLILPYEMGRTLRLLQIIDREMPAAGSGHGYTPSQFVMPLLSLMYRQNY